MIEVTNHTSFDDIIENNLLYSSSDENQEIALKGAVSLKNSQDVKANNGNGLNMEKLNTLIQKLNHTYAGKSIQTKEMVDTNIHFVSSDEENLPYTFFETDDTTSIRHDDYIKKTFSASFNYQRTDSNVLLDGFLDFSSITIVEDVGWYSYYTKYILQIEIYIDGQLINSQYHYHFKDQDRKEDNYYKENFPVKYDPYIYNEYLNDGAVHRIELKGTLYQDPWEDRTTKLYLSFDNKWLDEVDYDTCRLTVYEFLTGNHQINPSDT